MHMQTTEISSIWAIDPVHSSLRFEVDYLLISSVSGWFTDLEGTVTAIGPTEPLDATHFADCGIHLTLYTRSVNTGNPERDAHLRSADFFNVAEYPAISFNSTSVTVAGDGIFNVTGLFTIKGIDREQTFILRFNGSAGDPHGNTKAGFSLETELSREAFGLSWNERIDGNRWLLGDRIRITASVQLLRLTSEPQIVQH